MYTFSTYNVKVQVAYRGRIWEDEQRVRTASPEAAIEAAVEILTQQGEEIVSVEVSKES